MRRSLAITVALALSLCATSAQALECLNSKPCHGVCIALTKTCQRLPPPPPLQCLNSKPCGSTCIPLHKVCRHRHGGGRH
ncbi:MAG: hypothetical protein ACHP7N_03700 [Caulobacterales bacterium]